MVSIKNKQTKTYEAKTSVARRTALYALSTVVVAGLSLALFAWLKGYRITSEGKVIPNGLVMVNPLDDAAKASVDAGNSQDTPTRLVLPAGGHQVSVGLDGYKPWQKSLDVTAGSLTLLDYIKLVPNTLKPVAVVSNGEGEQNLLITFDATDNQALSINKKTTGDKFNYIFKITKLTDDTTPQDVRAISIPVSLIPADTASDFTFTATSKFSKSRVMLAKKSANPATNEDIVVDVLKPENSFCASCLVNDDAKQRNLTNFAVDKIWLDAGNVMAVDTAKNLHRYTFDGAKLKEVESIKLVNFQLMGQNLLYSTLEGTASKLYYREVGKVHQINIDPADLPGIFAASNLAGLSSGDVFLVSYNPATNILNSYYAGVKKAVAVKNIAAGEEINFAQLGYSGKILVKNGAGLGDEIDVKSGVILSAFKVPEGSLSAVGENHFVVFAKDGAVFADGDGGNQYQLTKADGATILFTDTLRNYFTVDGGVIFKTGL